MKLYLCTLALALTLGVALPTAAQIDQTAELKMLENEAKSGQPGSELMLSLVSPLDALSDSYLFSVHMVQHMLLTLVALEFAAWYREQMIVVMRSQVTGMLSPYSSGLTATFHQRVNLVESMGAFVSAQTDYQVDAAEFATYAAHRPLRAFSAIFGSLRNCLRARSSCSSASHVFPISK